MGAINAINLGVNLAKYTEIKDCVNEPVTTDVMGGGKRKELNCLAFLKKI
jgi:hypothetical protein